MIPTIRSKYFTLLLLLVLTSTFLIVGTIYKVSAFLEPGYFTDLPVTHFSYDYVYELQDRGGIEGYADKTFRPDALMNRAELAKIAVWVARESGVIPKDKMTATGVVFSDIASDAWYYDYVALAVEAGIFEGYKDKSGKLTGAFGPNDFVTRAQAAKVFKIAANVPYQIMPKAPFLDIPRSAWFTDYAITMYNFSIMDGYKDSNGNVTEHFGSDDYVTRGQVTKIVINALSPVNRYTGFCKYQGYPEALEVCGYPQWWFEDDNETQSGSLMTESGSIMTSSGTVL